MWNRWISPHRRLSGEQRPHRVSAGDRAPWPLRPTIGIPRTVSTAISIGNR